MCVQPRVTCRLIGDLNQTALDAYCLRTLRDDVTTDTLISLVDRCADCVALAWSAREEPKVDDP